MSKWDSFGSKTLYNFNLPALSEEETLDLIKKAKKNDKESQEKLIFHNIKLILYTIKKFDHNSNYLEDLLEEAIFGFIEAINTYDDSRGKFSTYAVWMMRKYLRYTVVYYSPLSITSDAIFLQSKVSKAIIKLENSLGRKPSLEEISLETKLNKSRIKKILSSNYQFESYENIFNTRDTLEPGIEEAYENQELRTKIEEAIVKYLDDREIYTIILLYGFDNGKKRVVCEVASYLNVTHQTVCIIHKDCLTKLRNAEELDMYGILNSKLDTKVKTLPKVFPLLSYFPNYSLEELENIIATLPNNYQDILMKNYGEDLLGYRVNRLNFTEYLILFTKIIPTIKIELETANKKLKLELY